MVKEFDAVCEPHLTRRRFLTFALIAGMIPALTSQVDAVPGPGGRRFIERYAIGPNDPCALVHAIRGVGRDGRIHGERAAGDVLRTCVRVQEVNKRRYLSIPAHIDGHSNMFLETFREAGVPSSERFACDGRVCQLKDLGDAAKALFCFEPNTFDHNDLAWSLIAFAELHAHEWEHAYGERIQLKDVAAFGVQVLQEATQGLKPCAAAGLPLPKKLPVHSFTRGGTHRCYSVLVAARHGLLRAAGGDIVQELTANADLSPPGRP